MEKVLIVDDILINRILLGEIVQGLGYHVEYAENGQKAIEKLQANDIKIVLMDVEMPVMNGIDATKIIKSDSKLYKIKVIGVTAHDPKSFFKDYKDVKFDGFVTKPYTVRRIGSMLEELIVTT